MCPILDLRSGVGCLRLWVVDQGRTESLEGTGMGFVCPKSRGTAVEQERHYGDVSNEGDGLCEV